MKELENENEILKGQIKYFKRMLESANIREREAKAELKRFLTGNTSEQELLLFKQVAVQDVIQEDLKKIQKEYNQAKLTIKIADENKRMRAEEIIRLNEELQYTKEVLEETKRGFCRRESELERKHKKDIDRLEKEVKKKDVIIDRIEKQIDKDKAKELKTKQVKIRKVKQTAVEKAQAVHYLNSNRNVNVMNCSTERLMEEFGDIE